MLKAGEIVHGSRGAQWRIGPMKGKGTCTEVYQAHLIGDPGVQVALKIYREGDSITAAHDREGILLDLVSRAHGPCPQVVTTLDDFDHAGHPCFNQELLDFDVHQLNQASPNQGQSLYVIQRLARDMFVGLDRLHQTGFIHGDVKPSNLLWSSQDDCLKIIDFSISYHTEDRNAGELQSQGYRSPEVEQWNIWVREHNGTGGGEVRRSNGTAQLTALIQAMQIPQQPPNGSNPVPKPQRPCDMWAVACILMAMYSGNKLFTSDRYSQLHKLYNHSKREFPSLLSAAQSVIDVMIDRILVERDHDPQGGTPGALKALADLTKRLLRIQPGERLVAQDALKHSFFNFYIKPSHMDLLLLPSRILRFTNVAERKHYNDPRSLNAIREDIVGECEKYGHVEHSLLPGNPPGRGQVSASTSAGCDSDDESPPPQHEGVGKVYVVFTQSAHACAAYEALCRRTFNGHSVIITYFPAFHFKYGNLY